MLRKIICHIWGHDWTQVLPPRKKGTLNFLTNENPYIYFICTRCGVRGKGKVTYGNTSFGKALSYFYENTEEINEYPWEKILPYYIEESYDVVIWRNKK